MNHTDNVIDSTRCCSCCQARHLGEVMQAVYIWRIDYTVPQPLVKRDEHSHRA